MWYMNEERALVAKTIRAFAEKEVRPFVAEMEEKSASPKELIGRLGKLGFLGLTISEELGGSGADFVNFGLMLEELGKVSNTFAFLVLLHSDVFSGFLSEVCNAAQREKYLKPALNGDLLLGAWITEPCGPNDPGGMQTRAEKIDGEWCINGSKIFATNADSADVAIVACAPAEKSVAIDSSTIRYLLVPTCVEGFSLGHVEHKVGWHGSGTGQVYFDHVRVPAENDLGHVKDAFNHRMYHAYAGYAAAMLGSMEGVLAQTVNYLKQRKEADTSLWNAHEVVRYEAAQLWAKIAIFRNAVFSAMESLNQGKDIVNLAIALKAEGEHLMEHVCSECMTLCGGVGLIRETGIERFYRDAKLNAIACGSVKTTMSILGDSL